MDSLFPKNVTFRIFLLVLLLLMSVLLRLPWSSISLFVLLMVILFLARLAIDILSGVLSILLLLVRTFLTLSIFGVSLFLLPLRSTTVTFGFYAIFVGLSLFLSSFLVPARYSSRPTPMLHGRVILWIAVHFLLIVFFLVVLSLPGRRRSRLQFPVRVQRLSCALWLF